MTRSDWDAVVQVAAVIVAAVVIGTGISTVVRSQDASIDAAYAARGQ